MMEIIRYGCENNEMLAILKEEVNHCTMSCFGCNCD